ncbi:MAG TPA: tRNA (adenosine(37)-N6)-dimethylallyltransferase MiaA [Gemmatimonadaceae bacterium]|nr:tRNA (adenosine(37)-N6)-dimethylallyltransferase MiaA [Gemmatimonadaceae bacterium]
MSVDSAGDELLVICGATAAGKSAVAMWLAEQAPTTIISADSRQIYRGFDIGTVKPTPDEQRHVPHEGIDVVEPTTRYSAAAWAGAADAWLDRALGSGRRPLIVGGTGLYLRALFDGLFEEPLLEPAKRDALAQALSQVDLAELRRWATELDPARAHLGRTQLLRSIEIALLTGRRMSELHRDGARSSRWRARYLVVDPGPSLAQRIDARIDAMFDYGWLDEVHRLMQTVPATAPAWKSTGYDAMRRLARGEITRAQAREMILVHTRQYAKRQRTWFRHQLPAQAVTVLDPLAADWRTVVSQWAAGAQLSRTGA